MRLIQHYIFNIKTKVPFSEWPEIVHRFMYENHLTSHRFLYFFEDILSDNEAKDEALPRSSCAKILKDCPSDAFHLNTSIMIRQIRKELLPRKESL